MAACWRSADVVKTRSVKNHHARPVCRDRVAAGCRHGFDAHDSPSSARWPKLAGEPAYGVSFKGVYGKANDVNAVASAAFEGTLLDPPFARRNPRKSHPVLAGRAHRPLDNGITHHPPPRKKICGDAATGLSGTRPFTKICRVAGDTPTEPGLANSSAVAGAPKTTEAVADQRRSAGISRAGSEAAIGRRCSDLRGGRRNPEGKTECRAAGDRSAGAIPGRRRARRRPTSLQRC